MKVNGSILTDEGFIEGHVVLENGVVKRISNGMVPYPDATGIVIPYFFNHHTHIGDSFIRRVPKLPIDHVVGPGGFKQRALEAADDDTVLAGMDRGISVMESSHTSGFMDFREGGKEGVELIRAALRDHEVSATILSRPVEWTEEEMDELLDISDGFGISSISDHEYDLILAASEKAHSRGKIFAIHFSERIAEDVGLLLDLRPDFIVHAIEVDDDGFAAIADAGIPVVICPRSNAFFGKRPKIKELVEHGIDVRLGTDNGMFAKPDILEEYRHLYLSTPKKDRQYVESVLPGIFERKGLKERSVGIREGQRVLLVRAPWLSPVKGLVTGEIMPMAGSESYGRHKEDTDSD